MKLNYKKTVCVGFAFLLICLFWQVYDNIIAKILIDAFGLNQTWSGLVMALDNVLALLLLPLFGKLSDNTKTKWGKRTPYIVIGTIVSAALIIFVGVFDKMQSIKIQEANIPGIETITAQVDIIINSVKVNAGDNYYVYKDIMYVTKELASNVRAADVAIIRQDNILIFIGFMGILLLTLVAMSTFRTPAVSLMPDVVIKPLRSKANAIINLMGAAGGIVALGFITFIAHDYQSYLPIFIVLAILMIIFLAIFIFTVNEKKLVKDMEQEMIAYNLQEKEETVETINEEMPKDVKKSFILILLSIIFWFMAYNAATTKFSVYATNVLNISYSLPLMVANIAAIISYIPIGIISSKFGRKKTILVGIILLFVAFVLGSIATEKTAFLVYFVMSIAGIGWATINVNSYPMIVEMSKSANVGKYTGIYYSASMFAQILTPVLSGLLMDHTPLGMRSLFPYSSVFCVFAFITMIFVHHGDSKPIAKGDKKDVLIDVINNLED